MLSGDFSSVEDRLNRDRDAIEEQLESQAEELLSPYLKADG